MRRRDNSEGALGGVERELRLLAHALRSTAEAVSITDTGNRILFVNAAFLRMYGYTEEELIGQHISIVAEEGADVIEEIRASTITEEWRGELINRRKDGSLFPIQLSTSVVRDEEGRPEALVGVATDITERREAECELARAKQDADRANQAKTAFLAHMSHEIRTPLNGIMGTAGLLLDAAANPQQRDLAATVLASSTALLAIVNDVLDLSKIEAGRLEIRPEPSDLAALVTDAVALMAPCARQKGLEFHLQGASQPLPVFGDGGRIRQILLNLVGNAIKFTDHGSVAVSLQCEPREDQTALFHFAVEDTGVGIPADKLPSLFAEFVQVDSSLTRRHDGTGLGLAISQRLAGLMGGSIAVESSPGKGSRFCFSVPLPVAAATPAADAADAAPDPCPPAAAPAASPGQAPRVLLVEDNAVNQKLGRMMLERLGCAVEVAGDGQQAVDLLAGAPSDVVFMDCRMPVMDGYTATAQIRRSETGNRRTPVVAMTADAFQGVRDRCEAAGMDDYIGKPLGLARLAVALKKWGRGRA
jgi:PAS domain S-box-containing protein